MNFKKFFEKSIEQQKAERKQEREKEFEKLPLAVRRATDQKMWEDGELKSGGYVDGGYSNSQQEKDGTALWNFRKKASKKELTLLKKYEQYRKAGL
jgi:hypothetical protein